METKLTIRVPQVTLENAKRYARRHKTTLTRLVSEYLNQIPSESEALNDAPTVRRLSGILPPDLSLDDYQQHLDEKYGSA